MTPTVAEAIGGANGTAPPLFLEAHVVAFELGGSVRDLMVAVRAAAILLDVPLADLQVLVGAPRARVAAIVGRPVEDLLVFGVARG